MSKLIHRISMFKIPGADNQAKFVAAYEKMAKEQQDKDGKPYIVFLCAGVAQDEARSKGYTVVAQSQFRSKEEMKFFDEECSAHQTLKATVKELGPTEPPLTIYFEAAPVINVPDA